MLLKRFTCFLLFSLLSGNIFSQCPIIPSPTNYKETKGVFEFGIDFPILYKSNLPENLKSYFKSKLHEHLTTDIILLENEIPALVFKKTADNQVKDYYQIKVSSNLISISYSNNASCFYAINSLFQLIYQKDGKNYIKNCEITDSPKFEWRGLHLDVSRHFFTVEEVKRYIDLMAFYKFNTFHWHLTDDQGWRIEIKKFPKLTEIGAWRDSTVNKHYTTTPRTYTVERYGGFYTQEQIKEVVKYAQDHFVTIVPEIEMPGHARAALAAYPEFSCTGKQQNIPGLWGVFDDIYCAKQESIDFNKAILDEVLELFPSQYIHIGGDEAPKERWKKCPNCQKIIADNHLKDEHELQSYFIKQIDAYLTSKGRKLIGWDEILEGGLSPNASVMSWRETEGGIAAVKQGHAVVMSPGSHCYFDHYQSRNPNEPIAFGGFTSLEKVYSFNPVPKELNEQEAKLILGAQANLWTEYIPDFKQLEYMTYPRALALAEVLWSGENRPKLEVFEQKLIDFHIPLLQKKNVNFSKAIFYPEIKTYVKGKNLCYEINSKTTFDAQITGYDSKTVTKTKNFVYKIPLKNYNMINNWTLNLSSYLNDEIISKQDFAYIIHDNLGRQINFITPPNKKYAFNKELALADGIQGRIPWNSSEWLGFDTSTIVLEMDLGKEMNLEFLDLSFLNDISSWIHVPESIDIAIATEKGNWEIVKKFSLGKSNALNVNQDVRFLRLIIHTKSKIPEGNPGAGYTPWTFMDEIILEFGED
ncbi:MAG: beta-N-acetylhexosaminidase [Flavobacteriia bacterium]